MNGLFLLNFNNLYKKKKKRQITFFLDPVKDENNLGAVLENVTWGEQVKHTRKKKSEKDSGF